MISYLPPCLPYFRPVNRAQRRALAFSRLACPRCGRPSMRVLCWSCAPVVAPRGGQ